MVSLYAPASSGVPLLLSWTIQSRGGVLEKKRLDGGNKATTQAWWISAAGNTVTGRSLPIKTDGTDPNSDYETKAIGDWFESAKGFGKLGDENSGTGGTFTNILKLGNKSEAGLPGIS